AILRLCINSALKAAGDEHEVVVVDDASSEAETREFLSRCEASGFDNLTVLRNTENCGVSYSLNKAVENATGDLYAPVDHDDMVVPIGFQQMLGYMTYHGVSWTYSDELQITYKGIPCGFMHKPDFSLQLLRSVMYINHLQLISRDLFHIAGGYREGFEGSQDHDLALRLSERTSPIHVDVIAYLWRRGAISQSVIHGQITDASIQASRRAIEEHFARLALTADVKSVNVAPLPELLAQPTGTFISRILPQTVPKVSIIIPCRLGTTTVVDGNEIKVLEQCLQSIRRSLPAVDSHTLESPPLEIILVVNHENSLEEGRLLIKFFDLDGIAICDEPGFNFARKCNLGAQQSSGDILVFLNDDTDIQTSGWTSHIISLLEEDDVACVGGMLLNADRTVQSCGDNVGRNSAVHYAPESIASSVGDMMHRYIADHETTSVTGAFLCCKKDTFMKLDGFSTVFPNSFQDVDFCLRARSRGFRCITSPHVRLLHFESASRNPEVDASTLWLIRKFHPAMMGLVDPFAFYQYEKVRVPFFTLTALRYYLSQLRRLIRRGVFIMLTKLSREPRHPRGILDKSEWRIH
ncbi:MAG: glycosyltransferase, partial [Pirellulaceae bacterium]|nr:glycosyltransferase [Pirellulaceae bacterium]